MIGDSIFTIHRYDIEVNEGQLNKPVYLIPFGDIHRFASLCDVDKWYEFLEWAKSKPHAYFLGMGDYDDLVSCSERKELMIAALHDETRATLEEIYANRTNRLIKEIEFMRGRLIGLMEGNHHGIFQTGMTTTQMMCDKLKCKYLGISTFIRLSFHRGHKTSSIDIWTHHGRGASRLVGGSLNSVQQMIDSAEADIYLMSHDHKKPCALKNRLVLTSGRGGLELSHKKVLMARCGSFLKGYVPNHPSYIARAAMSPTDMGVVKIELTPKRDKRNKKDLFYVDIHASI